MRRLVPFSLAVLLLAGCGESDTSAVEGEEFVAEIEIPLSAEVEEPEVYGRAGFSPNGRNGTQFVIRLDKPFKSKLEAYIRRGGCGGSFRGIAGLGSADFDLGEVKDGKLETDVDAPTRDLRRTGYGLVVREPISEKEQAQATRRNRIFEKGGCAELGSADEVGDE